MRSNTFKTELIRSKTIHLLSSTLDLWKDLLIRKESRESYQLLPLKSAPYMHFFNLRGLPKCCDKFGQKQDYSLSKITNILFVPLDYMKTCVKSNWQILDMFLAASAMKHFRSLVEAVSDQDMKSSFICMYPLRQILAFNLSNPPYIFNLFLQANFVGIISSAGSGISFRRKVSLSNKPVTSDLIASPHFSLVKEDICSIWLRLLGSKIQSDKLTCLSVSVSSSFFI